jgi:hypothetical protein
MRYCSGCSLMPDAVDDAVVADYLRYRAETTLLAAGSMAHRSIARAWNASAGENPAWPAHFADGEHGFHAMVSRNFARS